MLTEIILIIVALVIVWLLFKIVKNLFVIALNSVIGIFALYGFNSIFGTAININFWSVIITAIGGIFGFALVLLFYFLGWAFV